MAAMLEITLVIMAVVLTVISSSLGVVVWRRSKRDFRIGFVMLMAAENIIFWAYITEVASPDLGTKLFWNNFEYLGYVTAVVSFFLLAVQYSTDAKMDWRMATLLGIPAVLTMLAVITNPYHNLFYLSTALSSNYYRSFDPIYGPLFYAYMAYSAVIMMAGLTVLIVRLARAPRAHRPRVSITCLAAMMAVGSVYINFSSAVPVPGGIMLIIGFLSSDLLMFIGAFGFELFSMVPFEIDRILHLSKNGVFILDENGVIQYQNPAAESLTGNKAVVSKDRLEDVLPTFPRDVLEGRKESSVDLEDIHELAPGRFFDVTVLPVHDYANRPIGKTITLREVTAQKRAEAEAMAAKHTLDLMNSITRHDVLNQLTVIEGNLIMAASKTDPGAMRKHIDASYKAAQNIQTHMQFARDYQEMTKRTPVWQNVEDKVLEASSSLDLKGAHLAVDTKGVEILADLLLEKVLYNLMHNSIVHGGKVDNIRFEARETNGRLELVYTDDGAGIDAKARPGLFSKGAGHNSGLGLFLSKEILAHSDMTITENGEPGQGARFVIGVPKGSYRNFNKSQPFSAPPMQPPELTP